MTVRPQDDTSGSHFLTPNRGAIPFIYETPPRGLLRASKHLTLVQAPGVGFTQHARSSPGLRAFYA